MSVHLILHQAQLKSGYLDMQELRPMDAMAEVEKFMNGDWKAFEEQVKATPIDLFEEVKKD
jgi:hypothetical protein